MSFQTVDQLSPDVHTAALHYGGIHPSWWQTRQCQQCHSACDRIHCRHRYPPIIHPTYPTYPYPVSPFSSQAQVGITGTTYMPGAVFDNTLGGTGTATYGTF